LQALNESIQNLPFIFTRGHVSRVSVKIPWRNLLKDSSRIVIEHLELVIEPSANLDKKGLPSLSLSSSRAFHLALLSHGG